MNRTKTAGRKTDLIKNLIHKRITEKLLGIIYPPECIFCKNEIDETCEDGICQNCLASLPYTKDGGCFETMGGASYLISPFMYEGGVKKAIRDLKFKSKKNNAVIFAKFICAYISNIAEIKSADLIVNVPLSPKSIQKRGFNQTEVIAEEVSRLTGIPFDGGVLVKTRETKRQSTLSTFYERARNILGAYECVKDVSKKTIILIDDVYTSGTTICNCANALLEEGAAKVIAVTAANAHKELGYSLHNYKGAHVPSVHGA